MKKVDWTKVIPAIIAILAVLAVASFETGGVKAAMSTDTVTHATSQAK